MNSCYVLSLLTALFLSVGFAQSLLKFHVFEANHVVFMILTSIVYFFTETLVIFFFVGTGVSIKEFSVEHKLDHAFHKRSINIKRKVYPPLLLNMFFMIVLFILVGAVDTHRFPSWLYETLFLGCIAHYLYVKWIENGCFRDNTHIILDMSGLR